MAPKKCTGCTSCSLTCAITYNNEFDLKKSHVQVKKNDLDGTFNIIFSSTCLSCGKCAEVCPSGCLSIIDSGNGGK
ncbi:MAG: hypothetical protein PWQ67_1803 [Clostridia bacterium]|jgi:carbon-monoxide dehydrogenase iron sulfur subunit|nr:hypothetical protein [Clostridia bacterium]MDN5323349.1 hypothetical protein [Clostridia bacterium]